MVADTIRCCTHRSSVPCRAETFCASCCQLLLVALQPSMVADTIRCCTRRSSVPCRAETTFLHIVLPTTLGGTATLDGCRCHQVLHSSQLRPLQGGNCVLPTALGGAATLDGCGCHQVLHSSKLSPCRALHRVANYSWWHCNPRWLRTPSGAALVAAPSLAGRRLRVANCSWWHRDPRWLRMPSGAAIAQRSVTVSWRVLFACSVANYSWWHCNPRWLRMPSVVLCSSKVADTIRRHVMRFLAWDLEFLDVVCRQHEDLRGRREAGGFSVSHTQELCIEPHRSLP